MLHIKRHIPLAPYSTFNLGGPADFFAQVTTVGELTEALEYARENGLKTFVFSGGSNLLISDAGFRGLVIQLTNKAIRVSGTKITADAGAILLDVVKTAAEHSLAGLERLAGIPGSLGGAIRGNAGAFGTEIGDTVVTVKYFDRKSESLKELAQRECGFTYRASIFKEKKEHVIISVVLNLEAGMQADLERIMRETMAKREKKHPQKALCAGSFFMNPLVSNEHLRQEFEKDTGMQARDGKLPAGWLIDYVGLRGKKVGGAQVSLLHPNYFVNTGQARAEDLVILGSLTKQRVRDELGIELKEEVQYVGF